MKQMVTLKAPTELALRMRIEAAKQNKSRSAAIREAMRLWLDLQENRTADSVQPGRDAALSAASDTPDKARV